MQLSPCKPPAVIHALLSSSIRGQHPCSLMKLGPPSESWILVVILTAVSYATTDW
jgi:hypothetical protein